MTPRINWMSCTWGKCPRTWFFFPSLLSGNLFLLWLRSLSWCGRWDGRTRRGCDWQDWRATANLDAIPATMIPFRQFIQCVQATIFKLGGQDYLFVCITLLAQSSWSRDNCADGVQNPKFIECQGTQQPNRCIDAFLIAVQSITASIANNWKWDNPRNLSFVKLQLFPGCALSSWNCSC